MDLGPRLSAEWRLRPLAALVLWLFAAPALADGAPTTEFADLSIEELANISVISVSRKPERLADAAAAVFVINSDDIRRSGASSLPELLRLAPNLQVALSNNGAYAISARGLNGAVGATPNKLLVLVDGRSVYSPLYSGVFWATQDMVLGDIERIEVVSGPGGTLWGVNAVNGVINIITRAAEDTHGSLLALEAGSRGRDATFRQGGKAGESGSYRVYGKFRQRDHTDTASGAPLEDAQHDGQVGFRADWRQGDGQLMLQGQAYRSTEQQAKPGAVLTNDKPALGDITSSGANLTAYWTHALDGGASLSVQAYYDRSLREVAPFFAERLDIVDLQFQHSLQPLGAHAVVWGANLRQSRDHVDNSKYIAFLPADLRQRWLSLFAQDEMSLAPDWRLTAGARLERNDYTGNEFLPTLRLAWKLAPTHALWAAASRTVRAPSRLDADIRVPGTPPFLLDGGPNVQSEVAMVYELGYRGQPHARMSYSATVFHNVYDHFRTQEVGPTKRYYLFDNRMEGKASGVEMWANFQAAPGWRLSAGGMALRETFATKPGSIDLAAPTSNLRDPAYTAQLRSAFTVLAGQEFDVSVRRVAALGGVVPAYTAVDARYGWKLRSNLELSVSGQNLNGSHGEYSPVATRSEIPRAVAVRLVWQG